MTTLPLGQRAPTFAEQYAKAKGAAELAEEQLWLFLPWMLGRPGAITTFDDAAPVQTAQGSGARWLRNLMDEADEARVQFQEATYRLDAERRLNVLRQAAYDAERKARRR